MRQALLNQLHAISRRSRHADAEFVVVTPVDAAALYDAIGTADWAGDRIAALTAEIQRLRGELLAAMEREAESQRQLDLPHVEVTR